MYTNIFYHSRIGSAPSFSLIIQHIWMRHPSLILVCPLRIGEFCLAADKW
jgi:hypothetical protein